MPKTMKMSEFPEAIEEVKTNYSVSEIAVKLNNVLFYSRENDNNLDPTALFMTDKLLTLCRKVIELEERIKELEGKK